jgi:hypothetical protein
MAITPKKQMPANKGETGGGVRGGSRGGSGERSKRGSNVGVSSGNGKTGRPVYSSGFEPQSAGKTRAATVTNKRVANKPLQTNKEVLKQTSNKGLAKTTKMVAKSPDAAKAANAKALKAAKKKGM